MLSEINEIVKKDPRYKIQAYAFVLAAIETARKITQKEKHVSGVDLLEGVKILAQREYGIMAKTVLESWGVKTTDDIGEIVFNLIDVKMLSKTDQDTKEEFHDVYDFEEVFVKEYSFTKDSLPPRHEDTDKGKK
ncbi:MAG: hypothetical protein KGZ86_01245 [Candidatus Latescibacteria bacterium]|nr:hypothetical protein [Candidatus Latescibacterota bacterium]